MIAVDFGTATTFDCVSPQGEYLGGVIAPGIHVAMDALFERAAMLTASSSRGRASVIGRNTTAALQSGMLYGYAGSSTRWSSASAASSAPRRAWWRPVGSPADRRRVRSIDRVEPFLTLEGLRMIYEKNRAVGAETEGAERRAPERGSKARKEQ